MKEVGDHLFFAKEMQKRISVFFDLEEEVKTYYKYESKRLGPFTIRNVCRE